MAARLGCSQQAVAQAEKPLSNPSWLVGARIGYNFHIVRDVPIDLQVVLDLPEGIERTAALTAWFQGLFPAGAEVPILVGGAAVEIYSGGAFTSGDLDFVGAISGKVAKLLEGAGFRQQGRHWIRDQGQVFLELPGSALEFPAQAIQSWIGSWEIRILSPEDVLVDRLASWQFWQSKADGVAAFQMFQRMAGSLDEARLEAAAQHSRVTPALERLRSLSGQLAGKTPTEEMLTWPTNES
jgi:hypothetical protein